MSRGELAVMFLALFAALASIVWAAIPVARHMAGVVVIETEALPLEASTPKGKPDLTALTSFAPFGRAPVQEASRATYQRPAITLRGVFAAQRGRSTALLEVAGETGLYRRDMKVAEVMVIAEIGTDFVRLEDEKGKLILRFDAGAETEAGAPVAIPQPDLIARMSESLSVPARYQRPGKPETTSEYIDYWRHRIRKNPQAVLNEIGLRPTGEGYVIADKHDVGVRLAGLQSGDLVRMVNGLAVGDPKADRKLYDQIAASGFARLEVERSGKILSFSFPLR